MSKTPAPDDPNATNATNATPDSSVPVKEKNTETKGEAQARLEGEKPPLPAHLAQRRALRLARYKDDGTDSHDYTLTRATVLSFARTMQALVDADTTRHRQAIVDGALDGIDQLVYPEPAPRLDKPDKSAPKK